MKNKDSKTKKSDESEELKPKYPKPKIILIDLPDDVFNSLRSESFNVSAGTFGIPYKVKPQKNYLPMSIEFDLPNHTEQEIIIIDLDPSTILEAPKNEVKLYDGQKCWWGNCENGIIDFSPLIKSIHRNDFDRILKHGGIFVIFANSRNTSTFLYGSEDDINVKDKDCDNWSFLSVLGSYNLNIKYDSGKEITIYDRSHPLCRFLKRHFQNAYYNATFTVSSIFEERWIPLMFNKYGECVGGLIKPNDDKGWILILPQISKTSELILGLVLELLPELSPNLFPYSEKGKWINKDEYALGSILKLKAKKNKMIQESKKKIEEINKKISDERESHDFIYRIITGTGDDLVDDVEECLRFIGFKDVRNVDKEIEEDEDKHRKQEDLQVCDKSPSLLVEVKGLTGYPAEDDIMQVSKYVSRRMKEWNRTDVRGVSIINHFRNIPALERDNAFTEPQIKDAEYNDITILTTWDLFLLIKGVIEWKWDPKTIQDLFYKKGKMQRFPTHYKPIGKIVKHWGKAGAIGIELTEKLHIGQRIGYVLDNGFLEEDVSSLQVDNRDVEKASSGKLAGVKTVYSKDILKEGTIVYKIDNG